MSRRVLLFTFAAFACGGMNLSAQPPAKASPSPSPVASPPVPSSSPSARALIDSMDSADLKEAIQLLKNNYIKPETLNETELSRAAFEGVLTRLGRGVILLGNPNAEPSEPPAPFYGE